MNGNAPATPVAGTIYTVGGAVGGGAGVYLPRQADAELLALCRAGAFAYVLAPRQLGKSSLTLHTAAALAADGIRPVLIDLTAIGTRVTADAWYFGLIYEIADQLGLDADLLAWWEGHAPLSLAQRFTRFFHELVLPTLAAPVVVFVDEIDTTLSLDFTDDFFAAIRSFHDARAHTPDLARLSFVLIGVATPGDLIQDPRRTPFNIGQRVEMTDFSRDEARPLAAGLGLPPAAAEQVLDSVLAWTGGHPYLTQRLCQAITEEGRSRWDATAVRAVVERTFLGSGSSQDNNLQFVRDMLTKRAPDSVGVLITYRAIRQGTRPVFDEEQSLVKSHLKLAGIVRRDRNTLQVRNLIYRTVFDDHWVREHLPPAVNWVLWLRRALVGLAALFVVVVIGLGLLAEARRQDAEAARTLAEARALAIRAQAASDPEVSLLLATEAARRLQAGGVADTSGQISQVLFDALAASHVRQRFIHPAGVTSAAWDQDTYRLATTSVDGQVRLWLYPGVSGAADTPYAAAATGSVPQRARWSPDGAWLATAQADGTVQIWDVQNLWAGQTAPPAQILRGHSGAVLDVAFSADGTQLVSTSRDNTAIVWNAQTGLARRTLRGHSSWVRSAAWSPDGRQIATASADTTARIWDALTGTSVRVLQGHTRDVRAVAWSPDGRQIATASEDRTARIWDAADGTLLLTLHGHEAEVTDVAWSPDGRMLATASRDGTAKIWDAVSGQEQLTLRGHSGEVTAVTWDAAGQEVLTAGADGTARVWQATVEPALQRREAGTPFAAGTAGSARPALPPLSDLLVLAAARVTRSLTPAELEQFGLAPTPTVPPATLPPPLPTATPSPVPPPPTASATGGTVPTPPPPTGRIAFASNRSDPLQSHIYLMNADGSDQQRLTTAPLYNLYPAWSPDGTQLVYVGADPRTASDSPAGDLYLLGADGSGARQLTHGLNAKWPKWSPDGRWIVYADAPENTGAAYDLYLLALADGAIRRLTDTPGFDGMPAWTPDGQIVFAGARGGDPQDTHLYLMNADGSGVRPLTSGPGWEDSPAVALDGRRIAFVSTISGAERIYTMALDGSDVRAVTDGPGVDRYPGWSPDGQWLAFHSNRSDRTNFEIYIVPAAGGTAQRLTTDAAFDDEPAWQP